jgi:predicted metal-dependent RNase
MIEILFIARDEKYLIPPETKIVCDTPLGKKLLDYYITNNIEGYKHLLKAEFIDANNRDKILTEKKVIILSTSGMMDGGPIFKYFHLLEDNKNTLIACNYMDDSTIGHQITIKQDKIIEYNERGSNERKSLEIKAKIINIGGFSGHADQNDLKYYINHLKFNPNSTILINHGTLQRSMIALKNELHRKNIANNSQIILANIKEEYII